MMAGKRWFGGILAGLMIVSGSLVSVAGASELDCDGVHKGDPTRTFAVTVRVLEKVYEIGETAKFRVNVTRVIDGQDLGPVEGASVSVGVSRGKVFLSGGSITDANGDALVKVRIKRYASAGLADVYVLATKQTADIPCHSELEYEYGDVKVDGLFRIAR